MEKQKFRIIEEVKKRPSLWVCTNPSAVKAHLLKCEQLWKEVGDIIGEDALKCRIIWQKLRSQFNGEAYQIEKRIKKAKENGIFDPNKKYYTWMYFDALKFVRHGRRCTARYNVNFGYDADDDVEIVPEQTILVPNKSDVEIVDYYSNSDQTLSGSGRYFENNGESDSDIEIIENNLPAPQSGYIENNFYQSETDEIENIIPVIDSDDSMLDSTNFKSYRVSLSNFSQESENECASSSISNALAVKEEPKFQIESENLLIERKDMTDLQENKLSSLSTPDQSECSQSSNLLTNSNQCEEPDQSTNTEENTPGAPTTNDEDYCFLWSFFKPIKQMSRLQKEEFHASMKSLLLSVVPASSSVNILEKQLLLPEYNDPDKKFLISFWPFVKSMSKLENLQFRIKMADLILNILATGKSN